MNSCSFAGDINLGFTDLHRIPSTLEKVLEPLITTWRGFVCVHFFFHRRELSGFKRTFDRRNVKTLFRVPG